MTQNSVFIIEDDEAISRMLGTVLSAHHYQIRQAHCGREAIEELEHWTPTLILLDLGLPDLDGMELLRHIRKRTSVPVIVVSARSQERDKVEALDFGADDYLTKPFGTSELLARIRTALRHSASTDASLEQSGQVTVRGLTIDYDKYRVYVDGKDAGLTQSEFKLVALLGRHMGKVLTYDYLIGQLWGLTEKSDNQILRVNMANIRRKIEKNPAQPEYIFTEVGVGYRMVSPE